MSLEASEVAVRVRLIGGTAFERDARGVAGSVEDIGVAGKRANLDGTIGADSMSAGRKIHDFGTKLGRAGATLMGVGRSLAPVSAGIAGIGYYAVKAQTQFQQAMMLLVTQAGLPRRHLQGLTRDVLALSRAVGQTPKALAEGLFPIVSSGHHSPADAARLLRLAGVMAAVGGDTVDNTSTALMSILNTGFHPRGGASQIAAWLEATVGQGMMHLPQLTESMSSSILPMVKMTGEKLPQILAAAAALTRQGVDPSTVMSRMRLSLTSVTSPTNEGQLALAQMGLGKYALAHDLRSGPMGLLSMLQDLKQHTADMSSYKRNDLIAQIFGKSRGIGNIGALLESLPQMQRIYERVMHATPGLLESHFRETKGTSAFKFAQIRAQFESGMIKLGQAIQRELLPALAKLIPDLTKVVNWFGHLSPKTQDLIVKIGALVVVLSPVLMFLGGLLTVLGPLIEGIGIVITVVGGVSLGLMALVLAVGALVWIFRHQLWDALKAVGSFIAGVFLEGWRKSVTVAKELWTDFKGLVGVVRKLVDLFLHLGGSVGHFFGHIGGGLLHGVEHFFGHIPGLYAGGTVQSAGTVLVGERGPELLTLPQGASVSPLPTGAGTSLRVSGADGGPIQLVSYTLLDSKVIATSVAKVDRSNRNRK